MDIGKKREIEERMARLLDVIQPTVPVPPKVERTKPIARSLPIEVRTLPVEAPKPVIQHQPLPKRSPLPVENTLISNPVVQAVSAPPLVPRNPVDYRGLVSWGVFLVVIAVVVVEMYLFAFN